MMKVLGALVCATTLLCATASPALDIVPRAAGCYFRPTCDNTGEERIPIPCEGYCRSFFFCQNGKYTLQECPSFRKFNYYRRECEFGFNDCDWWKDDKDKTTTTEKPGDINPPGGQPPNGPPNNNSTELTTEGPCHFNAACDATGVEQKPIPCVGYCNQYYLCTEGKFSVERCPPFLNFDYVTRKCSFTFRDCEWYKSVETSSDPPPTRPIPVTTTTIRPPNPSTQPTTNSKKPDSGANSIYHPAFSVFITILIPVLSLCL